MSEDNPLSVFEFSNVVRLRAGDVVLFRCPKPLTGKQRSGAEEVLNAVFPDNETMILDGGQDIAVLRPEPGFIARTINRLFFRKAH